MTTYTTRGTIYDAQGAITARGVSVYSKGDTVTIGRTEHRHDEVTITAGRLTSINGWYVEWTPQDEPTIRQWHGECWLVVSAGEARDVVYGRGLTQDDAIRDATRWCDTLQGLRTVYATVGTDTPEEIDADTEWSEIARGRDLVATDDERFYTKYNRRTQ